MTKCTRIYWTQQRCRNSALCWPRLKSAGLNNGAEILHFIERDSNLLSPTTMQKFCTWLNETQIYWTHGQQRCRNSALCRAGLKSAELNNDSEILHFLERDPNLLSPTTFNCKIRATSMMQKFCTLFSNLTHSSKLNATSRNSALCSMANYIIIQFYWAEKIPKILKLFCLRGD